MSQKKVKAAKRAARAQHQITGAPSAWNDLLDLRAFRLPPVQRLVQDTAPFFSLARPWAPKSHQWQSMLQLAYCVSKLRANESCHGLLEQAANSLATTGGLETDTLSELAAAAFLCSLGHKVERLATDGAFQEKGRTPDFLINGDVEFEVTRANPKEEHTRGKHYANNLVKKIHQSERLFDVIALVAEPLEQPDEDSLIEAVRNIPGVPYASQSEPLWSVYSLPMKTNDGFETYTVKNPFRYPSWWRADRETLAIEAMGKFEAATCQTHVAYGLLAKGYLSPVRRKAGHFQGSRQRPLLVGLDVASLAGAFQNVRSGLSQAFPRWKHISGVLVFRRYWENTKLGWAFELHPNPHALRPLPVTLTPNLKAGCWAVVKDFAFEESSTVTVPPRNRKKNR